MHIKVTAEVRRFRYFFSKILNKMFVEVFLTKLLNTNKLIIRYYLLNINKKEKVLKLTLCLIKKFLTLVCRLILF